MNILDYLDWRGDLSFKKAPFNEIDSYICTQIATLEYGDIVPLQEKGKLLPEVVEEYFKDHPKEGKLGALQSEYVLTLMDRLSKTARYADVKLAHGAFKVVEEKTEQFSAITILLPDGTFVIAYRGTDDTIIGWKEDFQLATMESVPAQEDAVEYLQMVAKEHLGKIRITGHSKGGNLAVAAASNVPKIYQSRIKQVDNFDGPGFQETFLKDPGYRAIKKKITTVMPQHSTVGILLNTVGNKVYVHSNIMGPMAHDGFNWEVLGDKFIRENDLSEFSKNFDKAMDDTLANMTMEEKKEFIDELFDTLLSTGAVTLTELKESKVKELRVILKNFRDDERVKKFLKDVIDALTKEMKEDVHEDIENMVKKAKEKVAR